MAKNSFVAEVTFNVAHGIITTTLLSPFDALSSV